MNAGDDHRREGTPAERWLDEHGDAMYRYALLRLGNGDLAADAVQEALLAAMRGRERFRAESQERTWLIGILRHKVLDAIRAQRRAPASVDDPPAAFRNGWFRDEPANWIGLPTSENERHELRESLLESLRALPDLQRQAICLREIDGLDTSEICKILGVTPTNLWTLIHRAKLRLRDEMSRRWFRDERR